MTEGSIFLDGVDTSSIGLDCLRKSLAIIPQVGAWLLHPNILLLLYAKTNTAHQSRGAILFGFNLVEHTEHGARIGFSQEIQRDPLS